VTNCEIIRDLLPLYHDKACSPASRALVDEHIPSCALCRAMLGELEEPLPPAVNSFLPPPSRLRQAKNKLVRKTALAVTAQELTRITSADSGVASSRQPCTDQASRRAWDSY